MQKTTNYNLNKPEEYDFYNVADQNDNMDIIDAELAKRASKSMNIDVTLSAASWGGTEAPYTYTLENEQFKESNNIELIIPSNITAEQIKAYQEAMILNGTQAEGSITINAWGIKPDIDLPLLVIVRGD